MSNDGTTQTKKQGCCTEGARGCLHDMKEKTIPLVSEKLQHIGAVVEKETDAALSTLAEGMATISNKLRSSISDEGEIGKTIDTVASTFESGSAYLSGHRTRHIGRSVSHFIRKHPLSTLCVGLGLGFFVGRAISKRTIA